MTTEKKTPQHELALQFFGDRLLPFRDHMGAPFVRIDNRLYRADDPADMLLDLNHHYCEGTGHVLAPATQKALADILRGRGIFGALEMPVYRRVADYQGCIWLDLGERVVKVTPSGWAVTSPGDDGPLFQRGHGMRPLPVPVAPEASLHKLLGKILNNANSEEDLVLIGAWLLGTLQPSAPYPILTLIGGAGSGKSTVQRVLRTVVDPNAIPLAAAPQKEEQILITALYAHVVSYDNMSGMPHDVSDALCRLSTGDGIKKRKLFSDAGQAAYSVRNPAILNGIDDLAVRGDLASRSLQVEFRPIGEQDRRGERDFLAAFDELHPRLLGALLDCVSEGLKRYRSIGIPLPHRLSDWVRWVVACEPKAGWQSGSFLDALRANSRRTDSVAVEASPVAATLIEFCRARSEWEGTATDLLNLLTAEAGPRAMARAWPQNAIQMSNALMRLIGNIAEEGVLISRGRGKGGARLIQLRYKPKFGDKEAA